MSELFPFPAVLFLFSPSDCTYRLAKAAREEKDAQAAHDRNQEVLSVLRKQMAALEEQKEAARRLKEEEAQLLVSTGMLKVEFTVKI
jgi:chromosome segregation ATPase